MKKILTLLPIMLFAFFAMTQNVSAATTDDFVITVKTDNTGTSTDTQFKIPTTGTGYDYNVVCDAIGASGVSVHVTDISPGPDATYTCNYTTAGTYTIRITANSTGAGFPRIYFNNAGDKDKLLTIEQWGTGHWTSMEDAFKGCSHLTLTATDSPNLSVVTNMADMFLGAVSFNQSLGSWDVSNVTNMKSMFFGTTAFDQDLGNWDVINVTNMEHMLTGNGIISTANYDATLIGWSKLTLQPNIDLKTVSAFFCTSEVQRQHIIDTYHWVISDGGKIVVILQ